MFFRFLLLLLKRVGFFPLLRVNKARSKAEESCMSETENLDCISHYHHTLAVAPFLSRLLLFGLNVFRSSFNLGRPEKEKKRKENVSAMNKANSYSLQAARFSAQDVAIC
jgi:hypothetical protein